MWRLSSKSELPPLRDRWMRAESVHRYLIQRDRAELHASKDEVDHVVVDDDAAERSTAPDGLDSRENGRKDSAKHGRKDKNRGQNTDRHFGRSNDLMALCVSRAHTPEFSPQECKYGDDCRLLHDLRRYLKEGRRQDLDTFDGKCPVFEAHGRCWSGWRCRFVGSHMKELELADGRKELVLLDQAAHEDGHLANANDDGRSGVTNIVPFDVKMKLSRRRVNLEKSEAYIKWVSDDAKLINQCFHLQKGEDTDESSKALQVKEYRAKYVEAPIKPSEKRRIYFGRETPVLAPLTTQGNLPFRRLCVDLGAQATYSEMALATPLLQGTTADWALMKAHESEVTPPRFHPKDQNALAQGYDNAKDLKFGAQLAANNPAFAIKAAEALATYVPHLRVLDLNCGCPIDMLYKRGAGSALLDAPSKLDKMIRGMNAVSGEIPVTAKIRMGVKDDRPTALRLVERLAFGPPDTRDFIGPSGCAAVTLHGRSRQQRYSRAADWGYIAECAAMLETFRQTEGELLDTAREPDPSLLSNGGKMYFLGNGDCFTHQDYFDHLDNAKVDSVMIGRGAIIKPWIFEEIEKGQYLDKSATERLAYIEKFSRYGLDVWGSDEHGIGFTRRFLLEFLSFFHRYVPIGLLDYLPPQMNERPPRYRGRNDLETLLASDNYKDWIKIRYALIISKIFDIAVMAEFLQ